MLKKWLPEYDFYSRDENQSQTLEKKQVKEEVLDWTGFINRVLDDEVLAKNIFKEFLNETPKRIEKIHKSIDEGDVLEVKREAHTLKGSSANGDMMLSVFPMVMMPLKDYCSQRLYS